MDQPTGEHVGEQKQSSLIFFNECPKVVDRFRSEDNIYTDTIAIVVLNQTELDALLKTKWDGMKTSLINSNIESTLNCFHESSKEDYQEIFNLLIDRLPDIASAMREIELIYLEDKVAKYRIKKEEEIQGQTYDITYYIYFVKDVNGLWHIESF